MAISPKESAIHSSHEEKVKKVIKLVDEKLTDSYSLIKSKISNNTFKIMVSGELDVIEKEYVRQEYLNADWSEVLVRDSLDFIEKPGLICVILKQ